MLYICATPIGNLSDITYRAVEILQKADIILCEDTRNSQHLLSHYDIRGKKLVALHEHNENYIATQVVTWLSEDKIIVQISDAGTPGVSDPGARLCRYVLEAGYTPIPLPGACAYISLLSVAGITTTSQILFYGFLANKSGQRQKQLTGFINVNYAVAIYESPHRIIDSLNDMLLVFGDDLELVIGRELTKQFETIKRGKISEIIEFVNSEKNQQRGEFAIILLPKEINNDEEVAQLSSEQIATVVLLAKELPAKKAVNLTSQIVGGDRDLLYKYLLDNK